jgi:hypothetical protein
MIKKARAANPIRVSSANGDLTEVPAGPLWVLERASWVLLMWQSEAGEGRAEIPVRHYSQQVQLGVIQPG